MRRPLTRTVHAPHWPRSQPFLVPVRSKTLAQEVEQRHPRVFEFDVSLLAVYGEADGEDSWDTPISVAVVDNRGRGRFADQAGPAASPKGMCRLND